ncbi:cytochrome c biogenesis protein CcsA [Chitinivorax sp. B]|uniref:cytochrome C assembly family protein n=1 Tax=Chitinivorax sp. B TaxID=2502235 RepID=UPI0010F4F2CA|nr:cytochrome c biogenesis protein CcsA [Chitinivorax sp. B]
MRTLPLLSIAAYCSLAWYFWRTNRTERKLPLAAVQSMLLIALSLHGWTLVDAIWHSNVIGLGVGTALSITLFLSVSIFWLGMFFYPLASIQPALLATAAGAVITGIWMPPLHSFHGTELLAFRAHVLSAMLAYGLLTNAAIIALLMNVVDKRLHHHAFANHGPALPPLLSLESLLFKVLLSGFVVLTFTLLSGMLFSEEIFHQPFRLNHKNLFTVVAWLVFAALLTGRSILGWRGRIAVRWTLSGFGLLLLAYIGSKFVLEVVLQR